MVINVNIYKPLSLSEKMSLSFSKSYYIMNARS